MSKDVLVQVENAMYRDLINLHSAFTNLPMKTIRQIKYNHKLLTNGILHRNGQEITGL